MWCSRYISLHVVNQNGRYPTFSKVSQGSEKWVFITTYININDAINALKRRKFKIYAAHFSKTAIDYRNINYTEPVAILLGAEKWGVSKEAAQLVDGHITIPMLGMVQSLNVSVAASILLFEAIRQRESKSLLPLKGEGLSAEEYEKTLFEWSYPELASKLRKSGNKYPRINQHGEINEVVNN